MFDPYGAERHSQRTRQQRKAATRGQALRRARRDCAPSGPLSAAGRDLASGVSGSRCGGPFRRGHGPAGHFSVLVML